MYSRLQGKPHRHHHAPRTYLQFIYYVDQDGAQSGPKDAPRPHEPPSERLYMRPEKPPFHYPGNRNVRVNEPGAWKPPHAPFNSKIAAACILAPFTETLPPADRRFGDPHHDAKIEGFIRLQLPDPRNSKRTSAEVSVLRLGPGPETPTYTYDSPSKHYLLVTAHGKILFRRDLEEINTSYTEYTVSRVKTQFGKYPIVLLFTNSGANTRDFFYQLYRVHPDHVEELWENDWEDDGHSGSVQQGFGYSNFDFSALRSGRTNEFRVYSISGIHRTMLPGDEAYIKPRYTQRLYRWNKAAGKYLKVHEHTFTKS